MKQKMLLGLALCLTLWATFGIAYGLSGVKWLLPLAITFGTGAYHLLMRFLGPGVLWLFCRRRYDPHSRWFRPRAWENALYDKLKVRRWKNHISAYDPGEFDLKQHTLEEILNNMCHAEAVHETIMLLSLTSVGLAIPFGEWPVFCLTAVASALVDGVFVILQRYNRPRIMMILERREARRA